MTMPHHDYARYDADRSVPRLLRVRKPGVHAGTMMGTAICIRSSKRNIRSPSMRQIKGAPCSAPLQGEAPCTAQSGTVPRAGGAAGRPRPPSRAERPALAGIAGLARTAACAAACTAVNGQSQGFSTQLAGRMVAGSLSRPRDIPTRFSEQRFGVAASMSAYLGAPLTIPAQNLIACHWEGSACNGGTLLASERLLCCTYLFVSM